MELSKFTFINENGNLVFAFTHIEKPVPIDGIRTINGIPGGLFFTGLLFPNPLGWL